MTTLIANRSVDCFQISIKGKDEDVEKKYRIDANHSKKLRHRATPRTIVIQRIVEGVLMPGSSRRPPCVQLTIDSTTDTTFECVLFDKFSRTSKSRLNLFN